MRYPASVGAPDELMEAAIEAWADNMEGDAEAQEITSAPEHFFALRDALENRFGPPETARIEWRPVVTVPLDEEQAATVLRLLEVLEDSEDVQNVYANLDIPDSVMAKLSA